MENTEHDETTVGDVTDELLDSLDFEAFQHKHFMPRTVAGVIVRNTNGVTGLAIKLLINAANDYFFHPEERPGIESWMAGDDAPWPFEDTCTALGIVDLRAVKRFIRTHRPAKAEAYERKCALQQSQKTPANGPLAEDRDQHRPGSPGPEWLLEGQRDLDRTEAGGREAVAFPEELDHQKSVRGRDGVEVKCERGRVAERSSPRVSYIIEGTSFVGLIFRLSPAVAVGKPAEHSLLNGVTELCVK